MPFIRLPVALLAVVAVWGAGCFDQTHSITSKVGQEAAEELVGSLADACNRGDFTGFIAHFTPSHRARIRQRMEDIFVKHEPKMDIRRVTLLSVSEKQITFDVDYAWHPKGKPQEVLVSEVTARKVAGKWKIDREQVKAVTQTSAGS